MRWSSLLSLGLLFLLSAQQPMARGVASRLCLASGQFSPGGSAPQSEEDDAELLAQAASPGEQWRLQSIPEGTSRSSVRNPRPSLRMQCPSVAPREVGARWRAALLPRRLPPDDEPAPA